MIGEWGYTGMLDKINIDDRAVTLYSESLRSKFGFGDGDVPEHVWDFFEDCGHYDAGMQWRDVLVVLVGRYMVPLLPEDVVIYEIDTNHNPVRLVDADAEFEEVEVDVSWRNILDAWITLEEKG